MKEIVKIYTDDEIQARKKQLERYIQAARRLNKFGSDTPSNTMHGSEGLYLLLMKKEISARLYFLLVRIAEDPTIEYEIVQ